MNHRKFLNTGGLLLVVLLMFHLGQTRIHDVVFNRGFSHGLGLSLGGSRLGSLLLLKCELLIHEGHHPGIDRWNWSAVRLAGGHLGHHGIELSGVDQGGHLAVLVLSAGGLVAALQEAALGGETLLASGFALPLGILLLLGGLLGGVEGGDGSAGSSGGGPGGLLHLPPVDLAQGHLALLEGHVVGHLVPQVGLLAALLPHEAAGNGRDGFALGGRNAGPGVDAFKDLPGDLVLGGIAVGPGVVVLAGNDEATEGDIAGVVQNTVASAQKNVGIAQLRGGDLQGLSGNYGTGDGGGGIFSGHDGSRGWHWLAGLQQFKRRDLVGLGRDRFGSNFGSKM
mmetsp:Transcript_18803/g.54163  ORF Transcript_18803/g.54163 Transcript_18803/m.54163 type:complete len:338 (+) Transcript_18803:214-1227(+)